MPPVAAVFAGHAPLKRKLSSLSLPPAQAPLPVLFAPVPPADPAPASSTSRPSPSKRRRHVHDAALRSRAEWFANLTCYLWYAPPTAVRRTVASASPEPGARPSSLGTVHAPPPDPLCTGIASPPPSVADTSSVRLHPTSDFITFVHKILRTTQLSTSIVLVALYYLHRFKASQPHLTCAPGSEYRAAIVSLMLANKYLDDNTYTSKTWSEVSNIPLASLTKAEMELWRGLGLTVHVPADQFDLWSHQLQKITAERRDACVRQQQQQQQQQYRADARVSRRPSPSRPHAHAHTDSSSGYYLRSHTSRALRDRFSPIRSRSVGRVCSSLSPPRTWDQPAGSHLGTTVPVPLPAPVPAPASVASPLTSRHPSAGSPTSIWDATSTISTTPSTAPLSDGPPSSLLSPAYSSLVPSFPPCQVHAPAFSTSPTYSAPAPAPAPAPAQVQAADWHETRTVRCLSSDGAAPAPGGLTGNTDGLGITDYAPDGSAGTYANYAVGGPGRPAGPGRVPGPVATDRSSYFTMGTPLRSPARTLAAPAHGVHARQPETLAYYQLASGSLFGIRSYFVPSPYDTPTSSSTAPQSQSHSRASTPGPTGPAGSYCPLLPYTPPTPWISCGRASHGRHAGTSEPHNYHHAAAAYEPVAPAPPYGGPVRVPTHPTVAPQHHHHHHLERFNNGPQSDAWPAFAAGLHHRDHDHVATLPSRPW